MSVFKWVPLGGYFTAAIMPDMTTYNFYGEHFKKDYIHTHTIAGRTFKVLTAEYSSWFSLGGWWEQEVRFDAGYGKHGILVIGYTSWPWLGNFLGTIGVGAAGKALLQFIFEGSTDALATIITSLLSGVNVDAAIFTEV